MKIDIHNSLINWLISTQLYNGINRIVEKIATLDPTVKKVQMYGDFIKPEEGNIFGIYQFMDDDRVYYPLHSSTEKTYGIYSG
ncbi:MAG: hypothetical protein IJX51_00530 [Clostridia bacterium]|nr:hypothetical protein [Clostridia bacterium]